MSKTDYKKNIGLVLRELREERGLNQESFADQCEINRTYYGKVERGENALSIDKLETISVSLKIPLSTLMEKAETYGDK